jgi:hypothetical protein
MASPSVTLVLELEDTDTPSGTARLPGGRRRQFHGWLGLAAAINALTNPDGDGSGESSVRDHQTHTTTPSAAPKGRNST